MFKQDVSKSAWIVAPFGDSREVPAAANRAIEAMVPGCIHLDLIRAEIIKHPREGFAELDQFWVGKTDWRYECHFEATPGLFDHERIDLVCDGLDTIAAIELNGAQIGSAANMFHPHRFDARAALKPGPNTLAITFKSPLRHIREEEARLGARPVNGEWDPYIFIRKQASNFGWDFAPKVPTSGIWKPIRLEAWSGVRITGVRPQVYRTRVETWRVSVETDLEWAGGDRPPPDLLLGASLANHGLDAWASTAPELGKTPATISFDVENPRVWWPNGHGEHPLYHLNLSLRTAGHPSGISDDWSGDIGFREVRLHTEPDEHGSRFEIHVNGRPIFCKGANWVPEGLFAPEVTRDIYRQRVQQAADANMNMLRVWGGGYYESDDFYQACDKLGILVWQDFMFACAMYPEEAPLPKLVDAEARHQITRLSSHPSVALWCGGNECIWAYESWGNAPGETPWKERLGGKTWGRGYYLDLLPRLVSELDPTRPYWANSPWSGSEAIPTNGEKHGDRHTWDVRMEGYRTIAPRFCSEFGQQAPADWQTLEESIGTAQLTRGSRGLEHRQRATGGTAKHIDAPLGGRLKPDSTFRQWHGVAQLVQKLSLRTGIEWLRVLSPRCSGVLVWQLNDLWPCLSWSLIDSAGRHKEAYGGVRAAFWPRIVTIQPIDGRPCIWGINDSDQIWKSYSSLTLTDDDDSFLGEGVDIGFEIPPRTVFQIADVQEALGKAMGSYQIAHVNTEGEIVQWSCD